MKRNPATRRIVVPYAMYETDEHAVRAINAAASQHDWARTGHILAEDERVLWLVAEDHIELFYRARVGDDDTPLTEGV